jgi:mono/diheme cytochrome c family protein
MMTALCTAQPRNASRWWLVGAAALAALTLRPAVAGAQNATTPTFTKDIAPILQRSCQNCHRPNSVAPMSLISYEEVRPYARSIKQRTGLRDRMGVMPPWFIDKRIGIQDYKDDISLSEKEIATIAAWADGGAPRGNAADMPAPRVFTAENEWAIGQPDVIVDSPPVTMKANAPDWWGALPPVPIGVTEDRYVAAVEMKEVSTVRGGSGGKFIFHHAIHALFDANGVPVGGIGSPHEVGRNAEFFEPQAGRLMKAGSQLVFPSVHMHANAEDTTARLRVAYKFHPKGYKPERRAGGLTFGNGEIDLKPMTAGQEVHFYATLDQHTMLTTFEPHMHAAGVRMCMEAIWGGRTETLSCAGYDHNWVRVYKFGDDAAPLLPKGTLLHLIAYFDTTPANKNVVDPRNWGGLGHRSIDNMAILIAPTIVLNDQEFQEEMTRRRQKLNLAKGQTVLGCPLCGFEQVPSAPTGRGRAQ